MTTKVQLLLLLAGSLGFLATPGAGSVSTPLIGYSQGFDLTVAPPGGPNGNGNPNSECYVAGVPTVSGISSLAQGPVSLDTTQGSGTHSIKYSVASGYTIQNAVVSSPSSALSYETSSSSVVFNANKASVGDSGTAVSVLYKGGTQLCITTITFSTIASLTCAPTTSTAPAVSYPSSNTIVQNPSVSTIVIQNIIQITQITYNTVVVINNNNYNSFTCVCCFNSCNVYISNTTYIYPSVLPPTIGVPNLAPTKGVALKPSASPPTAIAPATVLPQVILPPTVAPTQAPATSTSGGSGLTTPGTSSGKRLM